jgi:hypothetical protein
VLHLLWAGHFVTDLDRPLSRSLGVSEQSADDVLMASHTSPVLSLTKRIPASCRGRRSSRCSFSTPVIPSRGAGHARFRRDSRLRLPAGECSFETLHGVVELDNRPRRSLGCLPPGQVHHRPALVLK